MARVEPRWPDAALTPRHPRCHIPVMSQIRKVCVYCGSSPGTDPAFVAAARRLGELLAQQRIGLVYGGGSGGLMGALATAVYQNGGEITGIIPEFLKSPERMFANAHDMVVTPGMHER
jgi:uncharacterized protein (TIGR00730 family)